MHLEGVCENIKFEGSGSEELCTRSAVFEDFLARGGAVLFEEIFSGEEASFSRRPGMVIDGLLRRKVQFSQAGIPIDAFGRIYSVPVCIINRFCNVILTG